MKITKVGAVRRIRKTVQLTKKMQIVVQTQALQESIIAQEQQEIDNALFTLGKIAARQ